MLKIDWGQLRTPKKTSVRYDVSIGVIVILSSTGCGPLLPPMDGSVKLLNGATFGSVANYFCNPGYFASTPMSRVCTETLVWSGLAPICIKSKSFKNRASLYICMK